MNLTVRIFLTFALFFSIYFSRAICYADDYASKQAEAEAALQTLNAMMIDFDRISNEYNDAIQRKIEAQNKINEVKETIKKKNDEIFSLQSKLSARSVQIYKEDNLTFLSVILDSSSFESFTNNLFLFDKINKQDSEMIVESKNKKKELQKAKKIYDEELKNAQQAEADAANAKESLNEQIKQTQILYESLSAEAAELLEKKSSQMLNETVQETISVEDISSYDESAGTAILSDGSQATVVGYDENGNAIVQRAYSALGSSYVWGGVGGSDGGYDCSGLVSYALTGSNQRIGTTGTFIGWNQVSNPQPGDVCVIHNNNSQHTGIYIGNGQMIHAADYGTGVVIGNVQNGMIYVRP